MQDWYTKVAVLRQNSSLLRNQQLMQRLVTLLREQDCARTKFDEPQGYVTRVGFVTVVGIIAALSTNLEYWNWYDFPSAYVTGYLITQVVGFLLVGLVAAAFVKSEHGARS